MAKTEHRDFAVFRDEVRGFDHRQAEILEMESGTIGRLVLNPGWRVLDRRQAGGWQPNACEVTPIFQYLVVRHLARPDAGR